MALASTHLTMPLPLTELASSIQNQVPQLLERTLRHTVESTVLENQCGNLKVRIEEVKARITKEREEQEALREKIVTLRAFGDSRLFNNLAFPDFDATVRARSNTQVPVEAPPDSPAMSLKSKRKGIVFPDEVNISENIAGSVIVH